MISLKHISIALVALCITACDDDDKTVPHATTTTSDTSKLVSSTTIEANRFVWDIMSFYYYWNAEIPQLDYRTQPNTSDYFYDLLSSKDRFSFITDDAEAFLDTEEGNYTSFGWSYFLSRISQENNDVVAVVTQVHDKTPAKAAGAKRGDVIFKINNTQLTVDNYQTLIKYDTNVTFSGTRGTDAFEYTMSTADVNINPVAKVSTFTLDDGRTAGYLLFNEYKDAFDDDLKAAFDLFKQQGVSELVLDLRYNNGGSLATAVSLCSGIAPEEAVGKDKPLLYYDFNKTLKQSYPETYALENAAELLNDTTIANLNLSRLIALCGPDTYSAAEATIWGLKPYMDVVTIGETTGGKNTMMFGLAPSDFTYTGTGRPYYSSTIDNWLAFPIVGQYLNADLEAFDTTDGDGFAPDYEVNELENLFSKGLYDLGEPEEPLLRAALEYLNTGAISANKSVAPEMVKITSSVAQKPHLCFKRQKVEL